MSEQESLFPKPYQPEKAKPRETPQRYIASVGGEGILKPSDVADLNAAEMRVLNLMRDGRWHSADEIIRVAGQREGLRRMRRLRILPGVDIEMRRISESRNYEYRLEERT